MSMLKPDILGFTTPILHLSFVSLDELIKSGSEVAMLYSLTGHLMSNWQSDKTYCFEICFEYLYEIETY